MRPIFDFLAAFSSLSTRFTVLNYVIHSLYYYYPAWCALNQNLRVWRIEIYCTNWNYSNTSFYHLYFSNMHLISSNVNRVRAKTYTKILLFFYWNWFYCPRYTFLLVYVLFQFTKNWITQYDLSHEPFSRDKVSNFQNQFVNKLTCKNTNFIFLILAGCTLRQFPYASK